MTAADWTTIGQPQDIRLVVADMDGTLLDERSRIPDGFWPMLARLKRRGVEFVPASGRQYATLRNMFADKAAEILDGGELSYIAENGNVAAMEQWASQNATGLAIMLVYFLLYGAVILAGFVLLIRNFRKAEFYIAPEELPRGTGARTVYGNVGMITFIVLTVLLTAISLFL